MRLITVRYATGSCYKQQEVAAIIDSSTIDDPQGRRVRVKDRFSFEFHSVPTDEPLERDLELMVRQKVRSAYREVMAPCIVEHAGLVLDRFADESYPGGLTQPMWDALGAGGFAQSVRWAGEGAVARAVIGYCDGLRVRTFVGETHGTLSPEPRGSREFYWDTVFCPDDGGGLTYAEIAEGENGLDRKVALSQSTKAMRRCLEHLLARSAAMFPDLS